MAIAGLGRLGNDDFHASSVGVAVFVGLNPFAIDWGWGQGCLHSEQLPKARTACHLLSVRGWGVVSHVVIKSTYFVTLLSEHSIVLYYEPCVC